MLFFLILTFRCSCGSLLVLHTGMHFNVSTPQASGVAGAHTRAFWSSGATDVHPEVSSSD